MYILCTFGLHVKKNLGLRGKQKNNNINNTLIKRTLPSWEFDFSPDHTLYYFF